ncbi:MAG: Ig-like domain-containing protein [Flavobacterium sp.]|nr:Ig-like domain-containing protein [Pedobacter sp.]
MLKNKRQLFSVFYLILLPSIYSAIGCASIQQPSGGPRDTISPKVIKENPKNLTRNFSANNIELEFNEFVKLNNEFTEISISPAIDKLPIFKARKEILNIKFEQPLEANTTYTINFGKAIVDVNESNVLKNYTYVFSTGDKIDSLSISGNIKNSITKQILKDATVFILPVKQDSIFGKKRANIFTTTDSSGNFRLQNLREDNYLLYALKEESIDRIYNNPNEEIGFLPDTIRLTKNIADLVVKVFKQDPQFFSVNEKKIEPDGRITLSFNKALTNPSVSILNPGNLDNLKTVEITSGKDSALIWLPEITFDSIRVAINNNGKPIDTVQISRSKRDSYKRAISFFDNLVAGKIKPGLDLILTLTSPIATFDPVKFSLLEDSIPIKGLQIVKDSSSTRKFKLKYPWKKDREYILNLSANAFTDLFGNKSKPLAQNILLDSEENFGTIALDFTVPDTSKSYIVQWLSQDSKIVRTDIINKNTVLSYIRYPTAKYKLRVIYDQNKNKVWDTGNVKQRRQPEEIWNYDKEITLRPNWDLEEKINIPKDQ